jgi:CRP-like cAMP-binding protein
MSRPNSQQVLGGVAAQAFIVERLQATAVAAHELVGVENEPADCMFIVVAGGPVELSQDGAPLCRYGPGEFFGEIDCLFSPVRIASVVALAPAALLRLPRAHLIDACERHAPLGARLRRAAVTRIKSYGEVLGEPLVGDNFMRAVSAVRERASEKETGRGRARCGERRRACLRTPNLLRSLPPRPLCLSAPLPSSSLSASSRASTASPQRRQRPRPRSRPRRRDRRRPCRRACRRPQQ